MENNFTVIQGSSDTVDTNRIMRVLAFHDCWERQYHNAIYRVFEENKGKQIADYPQEDLMKIAFSGIKYVNSVREIRRENERVGTDYKQTLEESQAVFQLMDAIFTIMGYIKLKNLITTFPVKKEFDGEKWGCKDYLYTMDILSKMDMDKPIGRDNIADLLWDYENDDLRHAYVEFTCAMSVIYRSQTGKSMAEKFCEDNGIGTYSINNETGIIRDNQTGHTMKLKKRSNIQIVK